MDKQQYKKILVSQRVQHIDVKKIRHYQSWLQKTIHRQFFTTVILLLFLGIYLLVMNNHHSRDDIPFKYDVSPNGIDSQFDVDTLINQEQSLFYRLTKALDLPRGSFDRLQNSNTFQPSDLVVEWSPAPINYAINSQDDKKSPTFMVKGDNNSYFYGYAYPARLNTPLFIDTLSQFAIDKSSGNILTSWQYAQTQSDCFTTENDTVSQIRCPHNESITTRVDVKNIKRNVVAEYVKSHPSDVLLYALQLKNLTHQDFTFTPEVFVGDLMEYGKITSIENGGHNAKSGVIRWPQATVSPGAIHTVHFTLTLHNRFPSSPQNIYRSSSYDCQLSIFYGTEKTLSVVCPPQKVVERFVHQPNSKLFMPLLGILIGSNSLLLFRNMQLYRESRFLLRSIQKGSKL
jgi:hypothetical protein